MEFQNILYQSSNHIGKITINRAAKLNALNQQTLHELEVLLTHIKDDQDIKGVIITGAGDKAFVAGADIQEFVDVNPAEAKVLAQKGHFIFTELIEKSQKPIIAAVNGYALGGGLELAMACHIRLGSNQAKLGLPELSLGIIPGYGGTQRLTQLVGKGHALQMILTADMVDAAHALSIGLINEIHPLENLLERAEEILLKIFSRSSTAVAAALDAVNAQVAKDRNGFEVEIENFANQFRTVDYKEGVTAFLEKRKPNF